MMMKIKITTAMIVSVLLMNLSACKAEVPAPARPSGLANDGATDAMRKQADTGAMIKIVPENPTAMTDLQAILSGMENVTWQWVKNGRILSDEKTERLSKSQFTKDDRITVSASSGMEALSASVTIANSRPKVASVSVTPQYIYHGVDITAIPVGYDADGDYVRFNYRWSINGRELSEYGATLRGDQFKKGDAVVLQATPYDSEGEGETFNASPLVIPNAPPRFVSLPPTQFSSNTYVYSARAEDLDGDSLTYTLSTAPKGMTVDNKSGVVTWRINKEDVGQHTVEITVQDDMGLKVFQKYSLDIAIPGEAIK